MTSFYAVPVYATYRKGKFFLAKLNAFLPDYKACLPAQADSKAKGKTLNDCAAHMRIFLRKGLARVIIGAVVQNLFYSCLSSL